MTTSPRQRTRVRVPRRRIGRGSPRDLAATLTTLGLHAQTSGRAVHARLPRHPSISVRIEPAWWRPPGAGPLPRRIWRWQHGNAAGWRPRADTTGVWVGVAALLLHSAKPGQPPPTGTT